MTERLRRWFAESRQPALKCERLGHVMRDRRQDVILDSDPNDSGSWRYYVAVEFTEVTPTCGRCGHTEQMRLEDKRGLTSFSTSSDRMKALRRDGRIEV